MNLLNSKINEIIEKSKFKRKIDNIFSLKNKNSSDIKRWIRTVNCCGNLAYLIGETEKFKNYAKILGLEQFLDFPLSEDAPGYIPPRAGLEFIRNNCREISIKELKEGDIILYMDRVYWCHAGVYIGDIAKKKIMFHKDGLESDFAFDDINYYEPLEHSTEKSFHRVLF